ncbi:LysM peptidoglycan-binding domain-containing protein [Pseudoalteromonas luteoviolacea]|uniref:LysM peptidoglycan-binding domain-containing protein n=1 Tax=Pseudoalteromonas luteoviolacea TaxID=43657 RepID=UPI001F30ADF3|nr:LysM peptidoglycan-binding domain-containing protein [Pseudoalteromonas luteoviolacea]MCF6438444.1 LysM peptidoglycan-binding domain-containing protein [Pseudoalteromonas luteoviolacea]
MRTVLKYTIQPGDSLALISISLRACAGVTPIDIEHANPALLSQEIISGALIKVPYFKASGYLNYEVINGDTLESICEGLVNAAGVTVMDIIEHNPHAHLNQLTAGQVLLVPFVPRVGYMTAQRSALAPSE